MDFILSALDYLFGIPVLGWGVHVGLIYKALLLLVGLLIFTAFILLADRKIWAAVQLRRGPNVVGPFGLLQSFADLLKFALKEAVIPGGADKVLFLLAPLITATLTLAGWAGSLAAQPFCGASRPRAPLAPPRLSPPRKVEAEAHAVATSSEAVRPASSTWALRTAWSCASSS